MEIVSLKEAREKGLKYYYTGIPCKHGHTTLRKTESRVCVECQKEIQRKSKRKWGELNREESIKRCRNYYNANKEKHLSSQKVWRNNNKDLICARDNKRRAGKLQATPAWSESEKIKKVYKEARKYGLHVDHIVPLQNPLVCGLHVWSNLQLLAPELNLSKKNKHWPDMPGEEVHDFYAAAA